MSHRDHHLADPAGDEHGTSIIALARTAMSGRWVWAALLAAVLGTGLAATAYTKVDPQYTARGYINITPRLDPILTDAPENSIANVDGFLLLQEQMLFSPVVMDEALVLDPDTIQETLGNRSDIEPVAALASLGFENRSRAVKELRNRLRTETMRRATTIEVAFESPDREQAYAVVQSVLAAYARIRGRLNDDIRADRRQRLTEAVAEAKGKLDTARASREDLAANPRLMGSPQMAIMMKVEELGRIDRMLADLEQARESMVADAADADGEDASTNAGPDLTALQEPTDADLEPLDPALATLRAERNVRRSEFETARLRYRGDHYTLRQARAVAEAAEAAYADAREAARIEWLNRQGVAAGSAGNGAIAARLPAGLQFSSVEALDEYVEAASRRRNVLATDVEALTRDQARLAGLDDEIDGLSAQLNAIQSRLRTFEIETTGRSDQLVNVQAAAKPVSPTNDKRKKLAAVGMAAGVTAGFAIFLAIGTLDRRAFASGQLDVSASSGRRWDFLGAIPDMDRQPDQMVDPRALAASCVHQIRNRIESRRRVDGAVAVAVSSPQQGDGKTSVALALAHSYARSGSPTVIVDCDLVGEGLTIASGLDDRPGLREVLRSGSVNGEVIPAGAEGLSILPSGRDLKIGPESIRTKDLKALLDQLRRKFEVIILDSGPMPGSVESMPVAAAVDGVVVVLRRGRQQALLDHCVAAIEDAGSRAYGVVLNRAMPADCERMVSASAVSLPAAAGRRRRLAEAASGSGARLSDVIDDAPEGPGG